MAIDKMQKNKNLIIFILLFFLFWQELLCANIDENIKRSKEILKNKNESAKKIKDKLEEIALNISKKEKDIKLIDEKIKKSDDFLESQKKEYEEKLRELNTLQKNIKSLNDMKNSTEANLIDIVSKLFSLEIILKQDSLKSIDSVVAHESTKAISNILKKKLNSVQTKYVTINRQISLLNNKIKKLKIYIDKMQKTKIKLSKMKSERLKSLKNLEYQKIAYDKKLNRIFKEQKAIISTLRKLNILKKQAISKKRKTLLRTSNVNNQKVRKLGNSFQKGSVIKYNGPKTIAPLSSFYVKRKFGTYFDPIYKIKIFNESVILSSKIPNAKVRNVLNGKVIFAKSTPMLDNVVIVENSNGIHTIYAHLSKIAPTIRKGMKIRKGYVIGRVKKDLTFEVTQKNSHIDPLRLIRF